MLGNKFFDTSLYVIVALWIIEFLLMLSLLNIKMSFPKFEETIDLIILTSVRIFEITMKLSIYIAGILLVIWCLYSI